ncbi:O-antigen ligase family protein [Neptuniibacter sp. PT8_73]|uniref:O-antigen ligase family protein n=1 Tax=Neptuniibacter sp. PT8_73 TaxID=3398206 RepID=UPI0039F4DD71
MRIFESNKFILFMVISACIYAAFKDSWKLFADIFQSLMILGSLAAVVIHWSFFKHEKILWLIPLAIILQLGSWYYCLSFYPELATSSPKVGNLLEFFVFFFVAFWLRGRQEYIWALLISFTLGSIFTLHLNGSLYADILAGLSGKRIDFDYRNAQHGALIIGGSILAMIGYCNYLLNKPVINKPLLGGAVLLVSFLFLLLVITQTRQAMLAIVLAMVCAIIYGMYLNKQIFLKNVSLILILCAIVLVVGNTEFINNRLNKELSIITDYVMTGDFSGAPFTSVGIRLQLWFESVSWIGKSPFLGFGNGVEAHLIEESSRLPKAVRVKFQHVHSSYVATLLRFGVLGLLLCLLILVLPIRDLFRCKLNSASARPIKYLAIMFLIYWLVVNIFESYWYMKSGLWTFTVIMAAVFSSPLSERYDRYMASLKGNGEPTSA